MLEAPGDFMGDQGCFSKPGKRNDYGGGAAMAGEETFQVRGPAVCFFDEAYILRFLGHSWGEAVAVD